MSTNSKRFNKTRRQRPTSRRAEMPRLHRGRQYGMGGDGRPRRPRYSAEDELEGLALDEILEIDEDELEEVLEEAPECPPGCEPAEPAEEEEAAEEVGEEEEDEGMAEAAVEEPVVTPEPTKEEMVTKWAPVYTEADIQRLDKTADVVMIPFFAQDDPSYVVLANGRPVGEIRQSDLGLPEDQTVEQQRDMFTDDSFMKGVIGSIEELGPKNIFKDLNLRYFATQVTQRQADAAAKNAVQADLEEAFQSRSAELKSRLLNNMLLAVEASTKNVFLRNDLREAVRKHFRQAGIPDPVIVDLFENAMQEGGAKFFEAIVNKADEWLGFENSAMEQVEATIKEADYSHPVERGLRVDPEVYEVGIPGHYAESAPPPIRTMQPQPPRQAEVEPEANWNSLKNVMRRASTINRGRR